MNKYKRRKIQKRQFKECQTETTKNHKKKWKNKMKNLICKYTCIYFIIIYKYISLLKNYHIIPSKLHDLLIYCAAKEKSIHFFTSKNVNTKRQKCKKIQKSKIQVLKSCKISWKSEFLIQKNTKLKQQKIEWTHWFFLPLRIFFKTKYLKKNIQK